jgi:type IV pilus assembly protein PilV
MSIIQSNKRGGIINRSNGATLIEVLIATLVLAVGLLGLAGLQATSIKNNLSAYKRSQATQLAYDMADRMRANRNESINLTTGNVITTSTYLTMAPTAAVAQTNCTTVTGCSSAQMAQHDLFQWNAALNTALPGGTGTIAVATNVFTITITWDDNSDGVINASDPNFAVSFQP